MQSSDKAFPRVQIAELNSQPSNFFVYCGTNILLFVPVFPSAFKRMEGVGWINSVTAKF